MSFFILPRINNNIFYLNSKLRIIFDHEKDDENDKKENIIINKTLFSYLKKVKTQIDGCQNEWDKYKKYTNPHEYIHSIIPNTKQSVCSLKPLSRSFYKMIEISNMMNIVDDLSHSIAANAANAANAASASASCKTFHLAEGPGGFIEAIVKLRNNPNDIYYGMTLINEQDHNVPGWNKSKHFLEENKNVIIENGKNGNGDLMDEENFLDCFSKYQNSMDLITADGGFDFSYDFNNQESECAKLIFCQICFAIAMQKVGGTFLIKFFDTFTRISIEMLYLLSTLYEDVYFIKPNTSRYANSEKYIVCKKYRANVNLNELVYNLYAMMKIMNLNSSISSRSTNISSLMDIEVPYIFTNKVEEYNAIFGQQQIENIHLTLQLIINNKRDKLEMMKKTHIQKCIEWCQKYNIPYHKNILNNNIFLSSLTTKLLV